ncbi:MAG: Asp23/Gls24 family envelope stress response protein [Clostridia bacterium]|nr:Asp23/Gls24 family envelope stress response protein [Clostridia bacterium]
MTPENEITTEVKATQGGKIVFAPDVVATIASFAATEVEGVVGMAGGVVEGITGMLNAKKSMTKGIKVEIGEEEVAVDLSLIIRYGYKLHEVCAKVQTGIKNAIETMTGLRVVQVNVSVQSISFDKPDAKAKAVEVQPAE